MKQFSLDEYLRNPSRKVVTRDGRNVKITCTNYNSFHPLIAEIEGLKCSESFTIEGKYYIKERDSQLDLFFATEKHEGWVNVFHDVVGVSCYAGTSIYKSKEEAEKNGKKWKSYIATVRIEWC